MSMGSLQPDAGFGGGEGYSFMEADHMLKGPGMLFPGGASDYGFSMEPPQMMKGGFQSEGFFDEGFFSPGKQPGDIIGKGEVGQQLEIHGCFSEITPFPPLPLNSFYVFAPTTFRMTLPPKGEMHDAGNDFVKFLDSENVKSTVKKVREHKGWVSADVFLDYQMVVLKARFYQEAQGYRLELQRRSGCVVAFNKVYDQVIAFYKGRGYGIDTSVLQASFGAMDVTPQLSFGEEMPTSLPGDFNFDFAPPPMPSLLGDGFDFAPPPLPEGFDDLPIPPIPPLGFGDDLCAQETINIDALVDQMMLTEVPSMQADAFNGLADLAPSKPQLFNDDNFVTNVKYLLCHSFPTDTECCFAFAQMLARVTKGPEATQKLAAADVLPLLTDKVHDRAVPSVVKRELAEAIAEAAKNMTARKGKESGMWINTLEASLSQGGSVADKKVQERMQEAHKVLAGGRF